MNTEYRAKFKPIGNGNVRRSFEEKVRYRRRRRLQEFHHDPLFWENGRISDRRTRKLSRSASPETPPKRPMKDLASPRAEIDFPKPDINVSPSKKYIPKLDFRSSPSPPLRQRLDFGNLPETRPLAPPIFVADAEAQTSLRLSRTITKDDSTQTPSKWKSSSITDNNNVDFVRELRSGRQRSRSPFACYALGDKEATVSGKRTFNIKATDKSHIYESARKAARIKHLPVGEQANGHKIRRRSRSFSDNVKKRVLYDF